MDFPTQIPSLRVLIIGLALLTLTAFAAGFGTEAAKYVFGSLTTPHTEPNPGGVQEKFTPGKVETFTPGEIEGAPKPGYGSAIIYPNKDIYYDTYTPKK
jgi:hypothetical protein